MKYLILPACFVLFIGAGCKKNRTQKPKTELEKLPPITQTGANTFGCLLNGEAFIPGGGGLFDKILTVQYDPTFEGGKLSIKAKKIKNGKSLNIVLNGDSINVAGNYPLTIHSRFSVFYSDTTSCRLHTYYDSPSSGFLNISRFDGINKVISGTFCFKVETDQCGEIKATDGRFDIQY